MGRFLDALQAEKITQAPPIPPKKPKQLDNSVISGRHLAHSEKSLHTDNASSKQLTSLNPLPNTVNSATSKKLSAAKFLGQVTRGLGVDVRTLLRLGVISQQDIDDLETGMYSEEHVDDYSALVEQQLRLKLVTGSNTK